MLQKKDNIQDLREMFMKADIDGSGFLDVGELYAAFKEKGAEITEDELANLMAEIDIDKNCMIDIDEFISLMTMGDQIQFQSQQSQMTFMQIQKSRRLNPTDFVKLFKDMPSSFVPSFIFDLWKKPQCLPSSAFKAQIDPATMLWKDARELRTEYDMKILDQIDPKTQNSKPFIRPIDSSIAAEIRIIDAHGVPLPQNKNGGFQEDQIVKRVLNVAIQHTEPSLGDFKDSPQPKFIANSIQIPADWDPDDKDIWTFDVNKMSQFLFRTTSQDRLDKGKTKLIFELVVYLLQGQGDAAKSTEMSCGWCSLDIQDLQRPQNYDLPISGGNPQSEQAIRQEDIRADRTYLNAFKKVIAGGVVEKRLQIKVTPILKAAVDVRYHITMMPSTCVIQKSLLHFASAFMNYKGRKLLGDQDRSLFKKPSGDTVITCFPYILDCPEIFENVSLIWNEDVVPEMKKMKAETNIEWLVKRMKDYVCRLYPVIYSSHFDQNRLENQAYSACTNKKLFFERIRLVESSLRYGQNYPIKQSSQKYEPPSELTSFKPFSVSELDFQIWDNTKSKQDQFLQRIDEKKKYQFLYN